MEFWKDVKDYEGYYQVSNLGRLRSLDREVWNGKVFFIKKGQIIERRSETNSGYLQVVLNKKGKKKYVAIHQLVAEAFVENDSPLTKTHIDHLYGDKYDNRAESLEWVTPKENTRRARENGLLKPVKKCDFKASQKQVSFNEELFESVADLADHLGVNKDFVYGMINKGSHKDLGIVKYTTGRRSKNEKTK